MQWTNRISKRFIDAEAFHCLFDCGLPKKRCKVLSLPAKDWFWERDFVATFPSANFEFVGLERDARIFRGMQKNAAIFNELNRRHVFRPVDEPTDVKDFVKQTSDSFDVIYLDWMGTWSTDKLTQICRIFENDLLRKNGVLRLTFALNRGKPGKWKPICDDYDPRLIGFRDLRGGGGPLPEWKIYGVPGLIMQLAHERGNRLRIIHNVAYLSRATPTSRGSSELSVMFLRR